MNETKITKEIIDKCKQYAPNKNCKDCVCTEKECIENIWELVLEEEE